MKMNFNARAGLYLQPGDGWDRKPSKRKAAPITTEYAKTYMKILYSRYKKNDTITHQDVLDVLGDVYAKVSFKLEVLQDDEKQRIFFITSLLKFLIDKVLLCPIFNSLKDYKNFMIGFRWADGGAQHLSEFLLFGEERIYFEWDLRRMDQNVKWGHIAYNLWLWYQDYDQQDPSPMKNEPETQYKQRKFNFLLTNLLLQWSTKNSSFTKTKWFSPNSWRIVIGILFSGEFLTSMSQTQTSLFAFVTWLMYIRELMEKFGAPEEHKRLIEALIRDPRFKFYGDDGIGSIPRILGKYLSLHSTSRTFDLEHDARYMKYSEFLVYFHGLELKVSETHEYESLETKVDKDCKITVRGPKILQRHFVRGVDPVTKADLLVSFRETALWKVSNPATEVISWPLALMRIVGAMWDTHGNNHTQYAALVNMFRHLARIHNLDEAEMGRQFRLKMEELYGVDPKVTTFFDRICDKHIGNSKDTLEAKMFMFLPSIDHLKRVFNFYKTKFDPQYPRIVKPWAYCRAKEMKAPLPFIFNANSDTNYDSDGNPLEYDTESDCDSDSD
jgi:hypothetical protein